MRTIQPPPTEEVGEWQRIDLPGATLTQADRALVRRLGERGAPRLAVDELRDGLRIQANSWVGLVRLGDVQVHVVPKLAGDYVGLVRLVEWVTGLDQLTDLESDPHIELAGSHLLDLVGLLLVREAERVLRRGARSDYVQHEDALGVLRGRLLFDRQLRRRHGRLDRLECRYDERSADIFDNRLLLAAVDRCATRAGERGLRRRAGRVRARLMQICDSSSISLPRRVVPYDRLNSHYRQAHELAWLVLEGTEGLDDLYASGDIRSFAFLLDMNRLFERFVERVLKASIAPRGAQLSFQRRSASVIRRADTGRTYSQLVPDVLASTDDPLTTWPIDAKYKRYSRRTVDPSDIAQVFLYATSLGVQPARRAPHALIVYPAESPELERTPLTVQRAGGSELATVTALGLPIPRILTEVTGPDGSGPLMRGVADAVLETVASAPGAA